MLHSNVRCPLFVLALTGLSGATGCATHITIHALQPGRVSLGPIRHLVLFDGEGRRSAREIVAQEFIREARSGGYFTTDDRSGQQVETVVSSGRRRPAFPDSAPKDSAAVQIDVLEWTSGRDTDEVWEKNEEGKRIKVEIPIHRGSALLAVTIFDATGKMYLTETEYAGTASGDVETPREQLIDEAAHDAITHLLDDITPTPVVNRVRLDDDEPGQEMIIETAKAGNIAQATADAERYLERRPRSAAAAYNLAVFLEALGRFDEALAAYDRALSLGNKTFYARARADCARRRAEMRSLAP